VQGFKAGRLIDGGLGVVDERRGGVELVNGLVKGDLGIGVLGKAMPLTLFVLRGLACTRSLITITSHSSAPHVYGWIHAGGETRQVWTCALRSTSSFSRFSRARVSWSRLSSTDRQRASSTSISPIAPEFLYQFIRHIKPSRVIEIGSGHSTKIAARACGQ
jgi:hypothetical protein